MKQRIKIMTWNIGSCYVPDSFNDVVIHIQLVNPDILCIQELIMDEDYERRIISNTELNHFHSMALSPNPYFDNKTMGIATFSKETIDFLDCTNLPNPGIAGMVNGNLEIMHDKGFSCVKTIGIHVINGHAYPFYRFKRNDFDFHEYYSILDDWIVEKYRTNCDLLIGADFNTNHTMKLLEKSHKLLVNGINGITRPNGRSTDCILYTDRFTLIESAIKHTAQDHHACSCKFEYTLG